MINIRQIYLPKFDTQNYKHIQNNIYYYSEGDYYTMAISFDLEENEDFRYPLEDILQQYSLFIAEVIEKDEKGRCMSIELAGKLEDVEETAQAIIGRRVYNSEFISEDGEVLIEVLIEEL